MYIATEILFNDKLYLYTSSNRRLCENVKMITSVRWDDDDDDEMSPSIFISFLFSLWPGLAWLDFCCVCVLFVACFYFNMVINLSEKIKTNELMLPCPYNNIENRYTHRCSEREIDRAKARERERASNRLCGV